MVPPAKKAPADRQRLQQVVCGALAHIPATRVVVTGGLFGGHATATGIQQSADENKENHCYQETFHVFHFRVEGYPIKTQKRKN
jgi:hypothetical protein